jgi:hypothetical protein
MIVLKAFPKSLRNFEQAEERLSVIPSLEKTKVPENCGEYCRTLSVLYGNEAFAVYDNFVESVRFSATAGG